MFNSAIYFFTARLITLLFIDMTTNSQKSLINFLVTGKKIIDIKY